MLTPYARSLPAGADRQLTLEVTRVGELARSGQRLATTVTAQSGLTKWGKLTAKGRDSVLLLRSIALRGLQAAKEDA